MVNIKQVGVSEIKSRIQASMICILILGMLIAGWNCGLVAINPNEELNNTSTRGSEPRSNGEINWSQIEVISEPEFGQDFNIAESSWPNIAVEDSKIYVVWEDANDTYGSGTDYDIFYRFFDGCKWSQIQVISEPVIGSDLNTGDSIRSEIVVENNNIYVVWDDATDWNGAGTDVDIFFRCNLTGNGWESIQVISEPVIGQNNNIGWSNTPVIAVDNSRVHVMWGDDNDTNGAGTDFDMFYRNNLTGSNWENIQVISEPIKGLNTNIGYSGQGRRGIAVENSNIYAVWGDENDTNGAGTDKDIFYRCNLTGNDWEEIQVISEPVVGSNTNTDFSGASRIAGENGKIYVVWIDYTDINGAGADRDIFFRCNLTGFSWEPIQVISEPVMGSNFNTGDTTRPYIDVENGKIFVTWEDTNDTNGAGTDWDLFYRHNLTGLNWEPVQVISEPVQNNNFNTGRSHKNSIAVKNGRCYIVWKDNNDTNGAGNNHDIFLRYTFTLNLNYPKVMPTSGNTSTYFNFTVKYFHIKSTAPTQITINISGTEHSMLEVDPMDTNYKDGKDYFYNITHLDIGVHTFKCWATDGVNNTFTPIFNKPTVYNTVPNIMTPDNLTVVENEYYQVSYDYEDIDVANIGQFGTWDQTTNASWLNFDNITATLNGTPTNDDVGTYWVNISIYDSLEIDYSNFTLTVIDVNDKPIINTINIETTYEDELYEVDYNATDIDSPLVDQIWTLGTNASSWIGIDPSTGILSGTPTDDEVGSYWVNVSVDDSENGFDFTNFTLTVLNVNDAPVIITTDITTAQADTLYEVDYNATDIDSPLSQQTWSLITNATWLELDSSTGVLSGTPTEADAGWYVVNVSVDDGDSGIDWHEFILTVVSEGLENKPPEITTIDKVSITAGEAYNIIYEATDDRTPLNSLIWSYNSNASWLSFNIITRVLSGAPSLANIGSYWVNITVGDGEGKFDSHNFTLTVYSTFNQPPLITTEDQLNAIVDTKYSVDYDATDDRTPIEYLHWSLKTNASWLTMHTSEGLLTGTPDSNDVGWYIVNVSVFDGEDGWDYHNFKLTVTTIPIPKNNAPVLSNPKMTPSEGDIETEFIFTVHYFDNDGDAPSSIKVVIDGSEYNMTLNAGQFSSNGIYNYLIKLSEGNHTYYFTASDGIETVSTETFTTSLNEIPEKPDKATSNRPILLIIVIFALLTIILVGLFIAGTEIGRYKFLSLIFIPLYNKIHHDKVFDNYTRGQIQGYIKARPGEHYNAIKNALELKNGILAHHLRILEKEGYVISKRDGFYTRFYPKGMNVSEPETLERNLVHIIDTQPGITQHKIISSLDLSQQIVSYNLIKLVREYKIRYEQHGREKRYYIIADQSKTL